MRFAGYPLAPLREGIELKDGRKIDSRDFARANDANIHHFLFSHRRAESL